METRRIKKTPIHKPQPPADTAIRTPVAKKYTAESGVGSVTVMVTRHSHV